MRITARGFGLALYFAKRLPVKQTETTEILQAETSPHICLTSQWSLLKQMSIVGISCGGKKQ